MYKYRYQLKEENTQSSKQFQQIRLNEFDEIIDLIGQIQPLLKDAKYETIKYYNNNPKSYAIIYSTNLIKDNLKDIITLLKPTK